MAEASIQLMAEGSSPDSTCGRLDFRRAPAMSLRRPEGTWMVAHTKPRQEKALAEALLAAGVPCFLPVISQARFYGHRKRLVELPIFPSYVFVHADADGRVTTLQTNRVVHVLKVSDQSGMEHELQQIDLAMAGGAQLDPFPYLAVGRPVVVVRGPFMGLQGLVDERRSWDRLVLNVAMLGQATSLEIDASLLEPAD